MINKNKKSKYHIQNYTNITIIIILIIGIYFNPVISDSVNSTEVSYNLKVVVGYAFKLNNDPASGGTVIITSSNGIKTSTVLYDGSWQVDISGTPGEPDWPEGTNFTVTITLNDLIGTTTSTVIGSISNVGTIWLDKNLDLPTIKTVKGGFHIKAIIATGNKECNWTIKVNSNLIILGGEGSGTIKANTQETVKLPLTVALGNTNIIVTANEIQKEYSAFVLGLLFLNLNEI